MEAKDKDAAASAPNANVILFRIPRELLSEICSLLPNRDLKSLRISCVMLSKLVDLRFSRVFLSANPLNISVFLAVAQDDHLRHAIREIIYDDGRLDSAWIDNFSGKELILTAPHVFPDGTTTDPYGLPEQTPERRELVAQRLARRRALPHFKLKPILTLEEKRCRAENGAMTWFRTSTRLQVDAVNHRMGNDNPLLPQHVRRSELMAVMALDCWRYGWGMYEKSVRDQVRVIDEEADKRALAYGLVRFPRLERVTITPSTHGFLFTPLYRTPMIRSLPATLNWPVPAGWPNKNCIPNQVSSRDWVSGTNRTRSRLAKFRKDFRGVVVVLQALADKVTADGSGALIVPELVIDVHGSKTGLEPYMFEKRPTEYYNMATILSQPGFQKLELPLMITDMASERWPPLVNRHIYDLLAKAPDLHHFRLTGDFYSNMSLHIPPGGSPHMPLSKILPVMQWKQLRHFGLSQIPVHKAELMAILCVLPETLQSVELSFLTFSKECGGYFQLLQEMKADLGWQTREPKNRPSVIIQLQQEGSCVPGRGVWLRDEISSFLYNEKPNPFDDQDDTVSYGIGVVKDQYEPEFERPHLDYDDMVKLGIYRPQECGCCGEGNTGTHT